MITAADLRELSQLGTLDTLSLELEPAGARALQLSDVAEVQISFGEVLYWSPRADALVWFRGVAAPVLAPVEDATGEAARVTRRWRGGRDVAEAGTIELPAIRGRWTTMGRATVIEYSSDKWNDTGHATGYTHRVRGRVIVYRLADASRECWACQGGRLRITGGRHSGRPWGGIADG